MCKELKKVCKLINALLMNISRTVAYNVNCACSSNLPFFFFLNSWSLKCPNSNGNNSRRLLGNCLFIFLSKTFLNFTFVDHIPIQIKATHVSFWSTIQHIVILLQFASESWDSSHSKSSVQNQWVPVQNAMSPNYTCIKRCQNSHETGLTCRRTLNVWLQKISIPPPRPRKTFWFAPPTPQDFSFQGVLDDPPPTRNFRSF